jgi:membrane associated rhomboid family serine protease
MPAEDPAAVPTCYRHPGRETYVRCQRCGRPICPDCMRDAAVGFQCPDCVAEGSRQARQARTRYGGLRSSRQGVVSLTLIAINAAVWAVVLATGGATSSLVQRLALIPRGQCSPEEGVWYPAVPSEAACHVFRPGATWYDGVATGAPWQLVTSMFTHVEVWHIGFNMLALWVLGPQLELMLGWKRFLGVYLLSGLIGSLTVYWLSAPTSPTLGASGAIFGLMGALLVLALKVKADVSQLMVWIGINFAITFFGRGYISWQGHLGGFLGGMLLAWLLAYAPRDRRTVWQGVGFGAVTLLVLVGVMLRTAQLT